MSVWFQQVSTGLNSSHCYILHGGSTVFTWCGNLTSSDDQALMERMLDLIKVICVNDLRFRIWELTSSGLSYGSCVFLLYTAK